MFLLLWMARKIPNKLREGDLFLSYLIGYPIIRFFLEFLRIDSPTVGVVNINQYFMLAVAIVAAFLLFWRHRKQAVSTEASTEVSTEEAEQTASETNS
jgi:phosphatidylglycerol:prolipoprotein diacylglycerol transferase